MAKKENGSPLDRDGRFRARVLSYGIRKSDKTKSACVSMLFGITAMWNDETKTWDDWSQYDQTIFGETYIVGRSGNLLTRGVETLQEVFGWGGNPEDFNEAGRDWPDCEIVCHFETYEGDERLKVTWINKAGGGAGKVSASTFSNVDDNWVREFKTLHGGELRALVGNAKRNAPAADTAAPVSDDDIPF